MVKLGGLYIEYCGCKFYVIKRNSKIAYLIKRVDYCFACEKYVHPNRYIYGDEYILKECTCIGNSRPLKTMEKLYGD